MEQNGVACSSQETEEVRDGVQEQGDAEQRGKERFGYQLEKSLGSRFEVFISR